MLKTQTRHILTLFLVFGICCSSIAQVIDLKKVKNSNHPALEAALYKYDILTLDLKDLKAINSQSSDEVLTLKIGHNDEINLQLEESHILGSGTRLRLLNETGELTIPSIDLNTYHGKIVDDPNSQVAITIAEDYFYASIVNAKHHYTIESLRNFDKTADLNKFVFYELKALKKDHSYTCKRHELISEINERATAKEYKSLACFDLDLAIAVDYMMYNNEGGTIQGVINYLASIYNLVGLDYDNEFNDQVTIRIKEVVVATCQTCDPWTTTNNVGNALEAIQNWGENGGFNETYDIGIYWTTRVYDDNFAGLAYQDQVCGDQRYIAVRKYTTNNAAVRIMMSHEIGHSLGCGHNFEIGSACDGNMGRGPKIMDPIVDPASLGWTNGTQSCDQNSVSVINAKLLSASCLGACQNFTCNSVTNLNVSNITQSGLSANWSGSSPNYRVRVKEEGSNSYIYNSVLSNTSVNINLPLSYCKQYHVSVRSICGSSADPAAITALVEIPGGSAIDILYVEPKDCDAGAYDLEVVVAYNNTVPGGFTLNANGTSQVFSYTSSPQTVTMLGINTSNNSDASLQAIGTSNNDIACIGSTTYSEPTSDCIITVCESFNNCELPFGWNATSTNTAVFSENFVWKFSDGLRNILNYGAAQNASTTKTINGTCSAYFDDDIFMNAGYTGIITLETRPYDLSNFTNVSIEVDYNFHNFQQGKMNNNQSEFSIDVFNGSSWVNVMFDNNDVCPWYDVWQSNCTTNFVLDVTNYINSQFKVRFVYSDGNSGDWTGMIMIDDFKVVGAQLPVLDLSILNFGGELVKDKAMLNWEVELDHTFSHYILERSSDGASFESIAKIEDNSQFVDNQLVVGSNYYRLKVYDNDGMAVSSDIVKLEYQPKNQISAFPNPVYNNKVTLVNGTHESYQEVRIFSIDGKELSKIPTNGKSSIDLDVTNLDQGVYLVQVSNSSSSKTIRLVRI